MNAKAARITVNEARRLVIIDELDKLYALIEAEAKQRNDTLQVTTDDWSKESLFYLASVDGYDVRVSFPHYKSRISW